MDLIYQYLENLKNAALANPIEFLATIAAIIGGIILYSTGALGKLFGRSSPAIAEEQPEGFDEAQAEFDPENTRILTLDQYESRLKTRETELRAELTAAHADEKALLQAQIDELTKQQEHPEDAFKAFKTRISELEALLGNAETEDEQEAKAALDAGDLIKADDIFARIQAAQAQNIKKAAKAAYARGEIAKEQIRWKDAATHFAEAARLDADTTRQNRSTARPSASMRSPSARRIPPMPPASTISRVCWKPPADTARQNRSITKPSTSSQDLSAKITPTPNKFTKISKPS